MPRADTTPNALDAGGAKAEHDCARRTVDATVERNFIVTSESILFSMSRRCVMKSGQLLDRLERWDQQLYFGEGA